MNGHLEVSNLRVNKNEKKKTIDEATIAEIRTRMQEISESIIEQVNDRINDMISEVLNKSEISLRNNSDNLGDKYCDKRKLSKESILLEKQFFERNSLLTDLFNTNKHVRTVYNIFITILIILLINTIAYDIVDGGSINVGMNIIIWSFGKFTRVLYIWSLMTLTTLGIYIPFYIWAHKRLHFLPLCNNKMVFYYSKNIIKHSFKIILIIYGII